MYVTNYANEFSIKFNGSKCCYFYFKGRNGKISTSSLTVNGVSLNVSEKAVHLGHHMSTKDKECTVNAAKNNFGVYLIMIMSTLF